MERLEQHIEQIQAADIADLMSIAGRHIHDNDQNIASSSVNNIADQHLYIGFIRGNHTVEGGPCCGCYPGAYCKQKYTKSDVAHVEPMFIVNKNIYSFTVNSKVGYAHGVEGKSFTRDGWEVYAIPFTRKQIHDMLKYCQSTCIKKVPYNNWITCTFFCVDIGPIEDSSFHCAEYTTRVLQAGGMLRNIQASSVTDAWLYDFFSKLPAAKKITEFDITRNIVK